jgi:protoporphyrinogen/coproporphyrinogen III oxidase
METYSGTGQDTYDTAVIGGGISGLSLAHYCAGAGRSTLVLEKDLRPGGTFCSHKTEADDFWFELGAHTCYNSYRNFIGLVRDCQLAGQVQSRSKAPFKMLVDGGLKSVLSQVGLFELIFSAPRLFFLKKTDRTVRSYYGRIVGSGNFARFFSAVFSAVPSQKADEFPADMLFKKRTRDKEFPRSFTLRDGLESLATELAARPGVAFVGGQDVVSVLRKGQGYQIRTADGVAYTSQNLALATPSSVAAQLLAQIEPQLAQHLAKVAVARVESLGVAVARDQVEFDDVAGVIPCDDHFFSMVSRDVFPHPKYRGFTFHFAPERLDRKAKLKRIGEILGIAPEAIIGVGEKINYVPSPRLGHGQWLEESERLLASTGILLTGNYFFGLSVEDCVTRSLAEFQRLRNF